MVTSYVKCIKYMLVDLEVGYRDRCL
jgi:hypothetical protein